MYYLYIQIIRYNRAKQDIIYYIKLIDYTIQDIYNTGYINNNIRYKRNINNKR